MGLKIGCIGLPNVGKSTLFNTLTKNKVPAENYPFCTIEPNQGITIVNDERLQVLAEMVHTETIIPAAIEVIDIAGLVKGASKGEGLGNQFLSHIKEVDLILHVVRLFEDETVIHVNPKIDPVEDVLTVKTELALKDLELLEKMLSSKKIDPKEKLILKKVHTNISKDIIGDYNEDERDYINNVGLLSVKPVIYVLNVSEKDATSNISIDGLNPSITLSVKLENELGNLEQEDQEMFLKEYGLTDSALNRLVTQAFHTLGLITFLTAGEKEVRAWPIVKGTKAPQASGTIHSDFEDKFIRMEVVKYDDYISYHGWEGAKGVGKMSVEGKDYEVQDGDIIIVRHGA